jgi:hypothetical protein
MPTPDVRVVDHSEFPATTGADLLALLVTRREIESGQFSKALASLMALTDEVDKVQHYRRRLVLFVHGYDHDPRELYQIPEAVSWFRSLAREWNAWIHYLAWDLDPTQLAILIRLLLGDVAFSEAAVLRTLAGLAEAHARFGSVHALSDDQIRTDVEEATAALYA